MALLLATACGGGLEIDSAVSTKPAPTAEVDATEATPAHADASDPASYCAEFPEAIRTVVAAAIPFQVADSHSYFNRWGDSRCWVSSRPPDAELTGESGEFELVVLAADSPAHSEGFTLYQTVRSSTSSAIVSSGEIPGLVRAGIVSWHLEWDYGDSPRNRYVQELIVVMPDGAEVFLHAAAEGSERGGPVEVSSYVASLPLLVAVMESVVDDLG